MKLFTKHKLKGRNEFSFCSKAIESIGMPVEFNTLNSRWGAVGGPLSQVIGIHVTLVAMRQNCARAHTQTQTQET